MLLRNGQRQPSRKFDSALHRAETALRRELPGGCAGAMVNSYQHEAKAATPLQIMKRDLM